MKAASGRRGLFLLLQTSNQRQLATKMVWPFSSSNAQAAEEPEQERSGYECAPYTVLETAADYQVFCLFSNFYHLCLGCHHHQKMVKLVQIGAKIPIHEVGNRDNDQVKQSLKCEFDF